MHPAHHLRVAGVGGGLLGALHGGQLGPLTGSGRCLGPAGRACPLLAMYIVADAQRPMIGHLLAYGIGGRVAGGVLVDVH